MTGRLPCKISVRLISVLIVMAFAPGLSLAGNGPMVEKNINELDRINNEAVRQIPDLPRNGSVDLKANVKMEGDKAKVEILEKNVYTGHDVTGENIGEQKSGGQKHSSAPVRDEKILFHPGNSLTPDSEDEANHDR